MAYGFNEDKSKYELSELESELTANNLEDIIDISAYVSTYNAFNFYTTPNDGYVEVTAGGSAINVIIRGANSGSATMNSATAANTKSLIYLRRGMRVSILGTITSGAVRFYPLS